MEKSLAKVMVVSPTPPPYSGPEIMTRHLLNSHLKEKYELIHFNISKQRAMSSKAKFDFVNIFFGIIQPIQLFFLLVWHRPDLVYTNWAQNWGGFLRYVTFISVIILFRIPIVVRVMGDGFNHFFTSRSPLAQKLIRFYLGQISGFIVRAEHLKEQFGDEVPKSKLHVVYTGIDTDEFQIERTIEDNSKLRILFVGYLTQAKGALDVLRSIPAIAKKHPEVIFQFMGERIDVERNIMYIDNPSSNNLTLDQLLNDPQINSNSTLLGVQTGQKKLETFVNADVFVMASYSEATPVVALEAMASGLPVVATPVGLLPVVFSDENILFFDVGNIDQLTIQLQKLIDDPLLRKKMGELNRNAVQESFDLKSYASRLESLFEQIIREHT